MKKLEEDFKSIFNEKIHNKLVERGDRKLSYKALWGALLVWLNPNDPSVYAAYQFLSSLVDLDQLIHRWRCKLTDS